MAATKITWCDVVWNPTRGCSRVSPGCDHCYAMRQARRHDYPGGYYEGLTRLRRKDNAVDWSGAVRFVPEKLHEPLRWKRPRRVFVNSMSDLFHKSLKNEDIAAVFGIMAAAPEHTFQVLTKRARRMREWFEWITRQETTTELGVALHYAQYRCSEPRLRRTRPILERQWPLSNVWLGVSAEDQKRADERIPDLLATPAAIRFVSAEPLLGPIVLPSGGHFYPHMEGTVDCAHGCGAWMGPTRSGGPTGKEPPEVGGFGPCPKNPELDWVIIGGESGAGARPFRYSWGWRLLKQCRKAKVPCFFKQVGQQPHDDFAGQGALRLRDRKGEDPEEWPEALRVREWPA